MPWNCMNPPVSCQKRKPMLSWFGPPPAVMMTDKMIRPTMVII